MNYAHQIAIWETINDTVNRFKNIFFV